MEAQETEKQINVARDAYRGVAARGAMLFFLLQSLSKIHAFYSFSLNAFLVSFGARGEGLLSVGMHKCRPLPPTSGPA